MPTSAPGDCASFEHPALPPDRLHPRVEPTARQAGADDHAGDGLQVTDADDVLAGLPVDEVAAWLPRQAGLFVEVTLERDRGFVAFG